MAINQNLDGYCTLANVQAVTGKTYSTTTKPTDTEAEDFIRRRADMINSACKRAGYEVPIPTSSVRASRILTHVNAIGAAADADNAVPGLQDQNERAEKWLEQFNQYLEDLISGTLDLLDATATGDQLVSHSDGGLVPAGSFNLDEQGDEREPAVDRDTEL